MTARVTFFPIGNADCCRIDLVGGRKILIDFADKQDPKDPYDKRIDVAAEVRRDLDDANRDYLDVVCFTHLDTDHVKASGEFFWFEHAACYQGSGRIKMREMWVPAAAVTEEGADDDARDSAGGAPPAQAWKRHQGLLPPRTASRSAGILGPDGRRPRIMHRGCGSDRARFLQRGPG
jgi:hypothetical protein